MLIPWRDTESYPTFCPHRTRVRRRPDGSQIRICAETGGECPKVCPADFGPWGAWRSV